uniref:Uridine diphosphate glucose pyrophosphatase NUDT14 n=1 Tax=Eptatretus burgeri TaxID=7764 RepID=A0A8C4NFL8_EPTBU
MEHISRVNVVPCTESKYLRPFRVFYTQNGVNKSWDFMKTHDSVMILIYNTSSRCFVFVKQFRPAVYMREMESHKNASAVAKKSCSASCADGCPFSELAENSGTSRASWKPSSPGVTLELCAGILDKDLCAMETASEEVLEECGYAVPAKALRRIACFRGGVGVSGGCMTMFYAEVTDSMRVPGAGGGCADEGEYIIPVDVPVAQAASLLDDRESDDHLCGGPFIAISLRGYKISWNV